jgi:serine protease Do
MENKTRSFSFVVIIIVLTIIFSTLTGGVMGFLAGVYSPQIVSQIKNPVIKKLLPQITINQPINTQTLQIIEDSATVTAVEKVTPAVVSIVVTKDLSAIYQNQFPFNDFWFGWPFNFNLPPAPQGKQEVGGGTGFVIDAAKGLIATNRHVVDDSEAEYSIITNDGDRYDAKVFARDPFNDLAILQVAAKDLVAVELGDSDTLAIGQTVIAIGNALGEYSNTVTRGVVSGIGRTIVAGGASGSERLEGIIQTDAAINPGNSGGPLINLAGQVIGINTAIDRQGQLVGFAIPINSVKKVISSVEEHGRIVRPYLGVRYIIINDKIAQQNNLSVYYGALILRGETRSDLAVVPGSPADKANLRENDIILEVDGQIINEDNSLAKLIQKYLPGDNIRLKVWSQGEEEDINVTLGEYQE